MPLVSITSAGVVIEATNPTIEAVDHGLRGLDHVTHRNR